MQRKTILVSPNVLIELYPICLITQNKINNTTTTHIPVYIIIIIIIIIIRGEAKRNSN